MADTALHAPTAGATADAAILAAWDRRSAAYAEYNNLPDALRSRDGISSPQEARLWNAIEAAEAEIAAAKPVTPAGIEVQLWTGIEAVINSPEAAEADALQRGDLERLEAIGEQLDWHVRTIISAMRSLRSLQEACATTPPAPSDAAEQKWSTAVAAYRRARAALDRPSDARLVSGRHDHEL